MTKRGPKRDTPKNYPPCSRIRARDAMLSLLSHVTCTWILPLLLAYAASKVFFRRVKALHGDGVVAVPLTPSTADAAQHELKLSDTSPPSWFIRANMSTPRLPLDASSIAAADAIEASDRRTFPSSFDLIASGGGLMAFYGGAVSSVLGTLARRGVLRIESLHGVSSGALVCATFLGVECGYTKLDDVYRCYQLFGHARWLSPAMRSFLDECLPPDVHTRATGRVHITVTEIGPDNTYVPTRRVVSDFPSRAAFLDAVMASTIIPGLTCAHLHQPPSRPGAKWMDGGVVKMPPQQPPARPFLKIAQLATLLRLKCAYAQSP